MSRSKNYIIYISIVTLFLLSFSCDIFKTRDPEDPSVNRSNFLPPTSPELVIENLKNTIKEKNSLNYIQCLSNGMYSSVIFAFIPSSDVQKQYLSIFSNWDINSERSYFENLKTQSSDYAFSELILNGAFSSSQTDSSIYNADYILTFKHDISSIPQIAKGNMQLTLYKDKNNNWSITKWIDNKSDNQFCWSELKARFSN